MLKKYIEDTYFEKWFKLRHREKDMFVYPVHWEIYKIRCHVYFKRHDGSWEFIDEGHMIEINDLIDNVFLVNRPGTLTVLNAELAKLYLIKG